MAEINLSYHKMFEKNLELAKQRLLAEMDTPDIFDWLPANARIINLPGENPTLLKANLELALTLLARHDAPPVVLIPEVGSNIP